jgi:hypothetical protein
MVTPADVAKKIKRQASIRTVKLGEIRVSPTGQRELNITRVKKILDNLDMERLGTLTVSSRDGFFWLIDGQHRFNALKDFFGDGFEDWEVEAWCYFDLTEEQEAEKFLQHNEVLAVDAFARFKVGVAAGRTVETDVDRIVRSLELKVTRTQGHGSVSAVTALMKVYRSYGPSGLVQTLWTIREGFGDRGFESVIIDGVSLFRGRYEGRVDPERLVKKMQTTLGGVKGLLNRANLIRERTGQTVPQCVAAAVTDVYNSGARGTQSLGSWWKDGKAAA